MKFTQVNNLFHDPSICDWRYKDTSWPYFASPSFLFDPRHEDITHLLEKQIPPTDQRVVWGPYHKSKESELGEFKFPYMKWINRRYDLKLFRIIESWRSSYLFTAINLGGGYWLQADGLNPKDESRTNKRAFYLAFFWNDSDRPAHDGGIRLRRFLEYFSKMPDNPFEHCFLRPTGHDILEHECPHLKLTNYKECPSHSTSRLKRFYEYWLNAKPTKYLDMLGNPYYIAESYNPQFGIQYEDPWPWPKLLEIET